jgi:UV DNA damage endonuclease
MIRLGLCCIFHSEPIKFRTTTARQLLKSERPLQLEKLGGLCQHNLESLFKALQYCSQNGIGDFRILSGLIPLATHPAIDFHWSELPNSKELNLLFHKCKVFSLQKNIRTTFHPDQFIVLSTPHPHVLRNSLAELEYQAEAASLIGSDVINVHAGGVYGDKKAALARLSEQLELLPREIKSRLTLENDDRNYTPADLFPVCITHNVPMVYDVHHHRCLSDGLTVEKTTENALKTWNREPLFHLSSPKNGWGNPNPQHHNDYINYDDFPDCWKELDLTIEVEAKAKELAIAKLREDLKPDNVSLVNDFHT